MEKALGYSLIILQYLFWLCLFQINILFPQSSTLLNAEMLQEVPISKAVQFTRGDSVKIALLLELDISVSTTAYTVHQHLYCYVCLFFCSKWWRATAWYCSKSAVCIVVSSMSYVFTPLAPLLQNKLIAPACKQRQSTTPTWKCFVYNGPCFCILGQSHNDLPAGGCVRGAVPQQNIWGRTASL